MTHNRKLFHINNGKPALFDNAYIILHLKLYQYTSQQSCVHSNTYTIKILSYQLMVLTNTTMRCT